VQNVPAKDTYHFPESLRRHITSWLEANGRFEEDEGSSQRQPTSEQNTASNVVKKEEVPPPIVTDTQAKQARETLNDMGYGVYASGEAEPEEKLSEKVKTIVQDVDQLVERINREENLPKASEVVQSINEMRATNVTTWNCGNEFSKLMSGLLKPSQNGGGTSINGTYLTMVATREFGQKVRAGASIFWKNALMMAHQLHVQ
jgi:hypothetical protein